MEGACVGRCDTCPSAMMPALRGRFNQLSSRHVPSTTRRSLRSSARVVRAAATTATDLSDLGALIRDSLQQQPQPKTEAASVKAPPVQEAGPPDVPQPTSPAPEAPQATSQAPENPQSPSQALEVPQSSGNAAPEAAESAPSHDVPAEASGFQAQDLSPTGDSLPNEVPSSGESPLGSGAASGVDAALDSASQAASSIADASRDTSAAVQDAAVSPPDSSTSALSEAAQSSADAVSDTASDLLGGATDGVSAARDAAQQLLDSANSATGDLQATASDFQGSVNSSLSSAFHTLQAATASAVGALPEPVQQVLSAVSDAAGSAAQQAADAAAAAPVPAAILAAGLVIAPLVIRSQSFRGSGGLIEPAEALRVLQKEDAVLIDIRADEVRQQAGVPALDRGALGKGVAVPFRRLPADIARSVRKADQLAFQVTAATVANLKIVRPESTRIIVMDRGDGQAVNIAKALKSVGCRRSSVLSGGFRKWASAGLPVEEYDTEYAVSPLRRLSTSTGQLAAQAAGSLRTRIGFPAVTAVAVTTAAVVDWHSTLQFVGVSATLLTTAARVTSYSSPQDAVDDLKGAYGRVSSTALAPINLLTGAVRKAQQATASVSRTASRSSQEALPASSQQDTDTVRQQ